MKILLIEDDKHQQESFKGSVEAFNDETNGNVIYEIASDVSQAFNKIDGSYDGVIIDLVLENDKEGGNEIVHKLGDSFTRIPIIFVTAFPNSVIDHPSVINVRSRSDGIYKSDLLEFQKIHDTGLTRIMGGRGLIEQTLSEVFLKNLLPQIQTWVSYGTKESERTEKALLRYTMNHLLQLLEEDEEDCFPEEVYLYPPISDRITTGSIVQADNQWFVVLSPACDLVTRKDGEFKTDRILLVEIESENNVVNNALDGIRKKDSKKNKLRDVFHNNYTDYYHWLPGTDFFDGGIINFRKLTTFEVDDFDEKFGKPTIQISPSFVKDIVSRFSSYYARQGQPNISSEDFVTRYTT